MKRLFFALAAAFALASCVEENAFVPEQKEEGKVIIEALATKTLLDGTNVVWEADDHIAVAFQMAEPVVQDFAAISASGASATFSGNFAAGSETAEGAFALYPYEHVTVDGGVLKISHNLPAEQDGVVDSDLNLSFAELDLEDLKDGKASANFKNALTLLKVVVPAGVKEVSLTSNSETLVGDAEFYAPQLGEMGRKSVSNGGKTVTLIKGGSDLEGTHYLLVYPANTNGLDLRMVGSDDTVYESTAASIKFLPSEYRTIDLTKVFKMETESTMRISPAGGELIVPVYTVADYTYEVVETADWLSYTLPTKGFHKDEIVFSAEANETGAERSAEVTITWGESQTRTFTIAQSAIFMDFLNDENGDPIQWEETFGLYSDAELKTQLTTFTNVFTIALSDDFSKGTYKVSNLFMVDAYYGEGYQQITNKGGEYYANYDVAKKELTILKENSVSGYTFTGNVVLTYDVANKTFSAERIQATLLNGSSYYNFGATRYLGNYAAAVKVEETPGNTGDLAAFVGTWTETYVNKPYSWSPETVYEGEFTVSIVDGKLYFENMFIYKMGSTVYTSDYYGTLSDDGTTITLEDANSSSPHGYFGPLSYQSDSPIVLTVEGNTLKVASAYSGQVANYVATKK